MKVESNSCQICVLSTGKLLDHDLAANTLSENRIPFYKQMETISGIKLAMPFQPAMGPGTYYNILVPEQFSEKAKQILAELPIDVTTEPELFHFGADPKVKARWKFYIWIILAIGVVVLFANLIQNIW